MRASQTRMAGAGAARKVVSMVSISRPDYRHLILVFQ
jgi:hypothetical protein